MKKILLLFSLLFSLTAMAQEKTLYDFKVKDIDGNEFDMASLKGKKVLIVNVASKCGFTPQYEQLEELYQKYKDENFIIIGFPCNDFKNQEPGSNSDIKQFCTLNYGVSFPIMDKVSVKSPNKSPIYKWLTEKKENGVMDAEVAWNFQKYTIDENGHLVACFESKESPLSDSIISWIEE